MCEVFEGAILFAGMPEEGLASSQVAVQSMMSRRVQCFFLHRVAMYHVPDELHFSDTSSPLRTSSLRPLLIPTPVPPPMHIPNSRAIVTVFPPE